MKLYAVRNRKTGELVNNLTNPKRRFWEKRGKCMLARLATPPRPLYRGQERIPGSGGV